MSAETLREAAALMRSRVAAADMPSPWRVQRAPSCYRGGVTEIYGRHVKAGFLTIYVPGSEDEPTVAARAEQIASWHPAVALAVADWLDYMSKAHEDGYLKGSHALAVATAYLGGQP